MKSCLPLATVSTVFLLSFAAFAETVLWYHFDEGANGAVMTGGNGAYAVTNAVNPTLLPGRAYQIGGTALVTSDSGDYMPLWTNGMPSCVSWYDPVTGVRGKDNRCMWVRSNGDTGARPASIIRVNDHASLHCAHITAECMVKMPEGKKLSADWSSILVMRNNGSSSLAWGIRAQVNGRMLVQIQDVNNSANNFDGKTYGVNGGGSGYFYTPNPGGSIPNFLDGKWHHLAITYDGAKVRAYIDYAEVASIDWSSGGSGSIVYGSGDNSKLCIGGLDGASYGSWPGCIDEVRISNEALQPSQFVRTGAKASALTDGDTALYLPFDSVEICTDPFFGPVDKPLVLNAAPITNAPVVNVTLPTNCMLPTETASTVSNVVHSGVFATNSAPDAGAWEFGVNPNQKGSSIHMTVDDYSVNGGSHHMTTGDFTLEFFLNVKERPAKTMYMFREMAASTGSTVSWYMMFSNNSADRLSCYLYPTNAGGSAQTVLVEGFTYDRWHHVALVVSRSLHTAALYLDGKECQRLENFDLRLPAATLAESLEVSGGVRGWGTDRDDQFHNLSIDELRITKRALEPLEFLKAGEVAAFEPTRMWVGFEGDLTVEPRPGEIPAGVKSANAEFSDVVWGDGTIVDGAGNVLRETNTRSMRFSGAKEKTYFARNLLIERDMESQTVEFFMKAPKDSATAWSYMLRAYTDSSMGDATNKMCWTIGYHDNAGSIYVGAVTSEFPDKSVTRYFEEEGSHDFDDGRWHHVAVTFEPDDTTNTLVTLYKDYGRCGEPKSINGRLKHISGEPYMRLGMGNGFNGWIDELRISKGVLRPSQMLHVGRSGMVILIR